MRKGGGSGVSRGLCGGGAVGCVERKAFRTYQPNPAKTDFVLRQSKSAKIDAPARIALDTMVLPNAQKKISCI